MQVRGKYWNLLYHFQQEGVAKLVPLEGEVAEAALIADDMGLGKTYEGVARDIELRNPHIYGGHPTLIVAPAGSHWNTWVKTIVELLGPNTIIWVIDRKKRMLLDYALRKAIKEGGWPRYVIIHYEALRLMPVLKEIEWFHIIADEVHRIKNRTAQQTRALKALKTKYKTGISGTPADDKPQDFWSVLNWLWPKDFRSYWRFVKETCVVEQQSAMGRSFKKVVGVNPVGAAEMLSTIYPCYLRRKKSEVGIDLPKKTYTERFVTLPPGQRKAYDEMRREMIAWVGENRDKPLAAGAVVAQLVRLQQFALASVDFEEVYEQDPVFRGPGVEPWRHLRSKVTLVDPSVKLDELEEIIDGNPDESIVVFSQSRSMSHLAVRRLEARGIVARPYTGSVSQHDRDLYETNFQAGHIQVLCGTIAAGGESITLHRSSTVVFFDRHWNPTKNRQAEDRAHRIGQIHPVQVIDIMARDTVDLGRKTRIANKWKALEYILGDRTNPEAYFN